ncbi:protein NRT1/ PTR FAMILY 5.3-like [Eucalyptus grandis]|uniref:protein NRT1/ PTR FAMILY 5.3-like n=1 Tax=Eucalyptus grandis TaxID=71139 RepID=UPI00192EA7AE|nr:protein NRT1/ PTR FAMILY 5.3-like [Eucalyptus grandis]
MSLLTPAISLPGLKQPRCLDADIDNCKKPITMQLAVFCGALYVLAVGTGETKPNISMIGTDQFDNFGPREKARKHSFKWTPCWALWCGFLTLGLAILIAVFLAGTPFYCHRVPAGSLLTRMARVIVAPRGSGGSRGPE